jgi:hypothetical protein
MIKNIIKLIIFMCLSQSAYAQDDQWVLDGGVGAFHSADKGLSETKMLTFGIQEDLWGPLKDRTVVGGYLDNAGNGKSGSALIAGQLGFEVNRDGLVAGIFAGPSIITTPDSLLGGYFEFTDDLHVGIQDRDNYIGVFYRHISDAGLTSVNIGRDVIGLELRF